MADWQIIFEDEAFPDRLTNAQASTPPTPPRRWAWLVSAILITLLVIGFFALRRQRLTGQAALRQALTAVVFEEETLRRQRNFDQAAAMIMPGAPRAWQQAYWQTFKSPSPIGGPTRGLIELGPIEFDGECAVIDVEVDGVMQVRAYCLRARRWRRAPVSTNTWGDVRVVAVLANGARLHYWPRDESFAVALARDLPGFFEQLAAVSETGFYRDLEIAIEPNDLHPPVVLDEGHRIILNSPWLVPPAGLAGLSGEAAVRLALAKALLGRAGLTGPGSGQDLPGAERFSEAVQTVAAMELILTPAVQAKLGDTWRQQVGGQWISPFFADVYNQGQPSIARRAEATAYLTADYISRQGRVETLLDIGLHLPQSGSWDELFQRTLNRSTISLELSVEASLREETAASSSPAASAKPGERTLPVTATYSHLERLTAHRYRLYLDVPGQAESLLVDAHSEASFSTTAGEAIPPTCIPVGSKLTIDGDWLEIQRRLRAARVFVDIASPLRIEPAAPDTLAYLVLGEPLGEQRVGPSERIYPGTKSYLVARRARSAQALVAVNDQGQLQHLTTLSPTLKILPLPFTQEKVHFLFELNMPDCDRTWLVHYEPGLGVTEFWLAPVHMSQWIWRADQQVPLFFSPRNVAPGYNILQAGGSLPYETVGRTNASMVFLGWNNLEQRLVATNSWFGETYVGLLDPASGYINRLPNYQALQEPKLSPDGTWLTHLAGLKNLFGPPDRLDVINLLGGVEKTLIQVEEGQGVGSAVWSLNMIDPALAVLTGPVVDAGDRFRATHLVVVSPSQPDGPFIVAQATEDEQLATPTFCPDGSLLYRLIRAGQQRLQQLRPGYPPETLVSLDVPFWPVGCA